MTMEPKTAPPAPKTPWLIITCKNRPRKCSQEQAIPEQCSQAHSNECRSLVAAQKVENKDLDEDDQRTLGVSAAAASSPSAQLCRNQ
jgi:hypothetical protein